ncbi:regulator [Saccharothrix sp. ST-888]|nr:regulator [Saccharothrix sp. ST-888]
MPSGTSEEEQARTITLEAFADTIVPGEKRSPTDRAVAGAAEGGGAVVAGAIDLLELPGAGLAPDLPNFATALNAHAATYAAEQDLALDGSVPPFVSLSFTHRTELVRRLTAIAHPERPLWVLLALFCNMAYDTGAHRHTAEAMADGHPGLVAMGFGKPDTDGLWRFSDFTYGRPLATSHPDTTASGSPA